MNPSTKAPDQLALLHERLARAQDLIPGGAHTYSKGDDQFPATAPKAIARGAGVRVWDVDGREYLDTGMGLRSVILGHAHPAVLDRVQRELALGSNFSRPSPIETELAERLIGLIPGAEMVKLAKDGSDVTSGAVRLARAFTGRPLVAVCKEHPFFSFNDWFIGSTVCSNGIPDQVRALTIGFSYNRPESLEQLFKQHPGQIACVMMEPVAFDEPTPGFLETVRAICDREGAVLVFDEMISGFRIDLRGAGHHYGVRADLITFGKGIANGFACSALVGRRDIMELGGLRHTRPRTFLLSSTHGGETHAIGAALATIDELERTDGPAHLARMGALLREGFEAQARELGLYPRVQFVAGYPASPAPAFLEKDGTPSFRMRTLYAQEMIRRGVFFPGYIALATGHGPAEIEEFLAASRPALAICAEADASDDYRALIGPPVKPVFRPYN